MDPTKNPVDPNRPGGGNPPEPGTSSKAKRPASITPRKSIDNDSAAESTFLSEMVAEFSTVKHGTSPSTKPEKFDMGLVSTEQDPTLDSKRFDERDFQSHRREHFPQTHLPLRPVHSRTNMKKKLSASNVKDTVEVQVGKAFGIVVPAQLKPAPEEHDENAPLLQSPKSKVPKPVSTVTEGPTTLFEEVIDFPSKKVQFELGGSPFNVEAGEPIAEKKHYKTAKYEDPQRRLRPGSELKNDPNLISILQGIEASEMADVDMDDLASHRFHDNKGFRRHRFYANKEPGQDDIAAAKNPDSKYDHQPHEVFVELDILSGQGDEREWKETARWIKYEEDVEEGADRWGRPHVASLSFHSLINLTGLLESGVVLLDLEERDLPGVAYRVVDQMGIDDLILAEEKAMVMRSLLLKHKHVEKSVWNIGLKRNSGSLTSLQPVGDDRSRPAGSRVLDSRLLQRRSSSGMRLLQQSSVPAQLSSANKEYQTNRSGGLSSPTHVALDMTKGSGFCTSADNLKWSKQDTDIMRRIPTDSEASIVLVGKDDSLQGPTIAFVRLAEGVYMPNITEIPIPVRFIFILLGPSSIDLDYKEIGRSISTLMSNRHFHDIAYRADDRKELLKGIHEFLDESIVLPPGDWDDELFPFHELKEKTKAIRLRKQRQAAVGKGHADFPDGRKSSQDDMTGDKDDPFKRTKHVFGGLLNDVKRRYPLYWSDIKDGLNMQCLATIIFLYFACVSGAVAFGGLMSQKTADFIGITETLIGTAVGGVVFALFSGQPLLLVGATGPVLVFDESLFKFCTGNGMTGQEILAVRTWIGIWMTVIGLIVVCFEGSVLVRFFTRFTQEIFATLISLVFIAESIKSLVQIYRSNPLIQTYSCNDNVISPKPNVALLSTILMFGTFIIAYSLRQFKTSRYLNNTARMTIGNFAVLIAIIVMVGIDELIEHPVTKKLDLPDALQQGLINTKMTARTWFILPTSLPPFWIAAAILPALLLYLLVFMEASIGELIVGKKEMKLRKGSGFHLDILILCLINTGMGFLGCCWISAATIRGVTHTAALTVFSTNNPPGEKPSILGVKEQRLTAFVVSILLGFSVLMASALKLIPMAVLFGVFLYMGISSMAGIEFLERVHLLLKQVQNHPQVHYVRRVRTWKMHIFTGIQIICLCALWGVKESPVALALPLMFICLIPFRYFILPFWFKPTELAALDAKSADDKEPSQPEVKGPVEIPMLDLASGRKKKINKNGVHAIPVDEHNGIIPPVTHGNGKNHNFRCI